MCHAATAAMLELAAPATREHTAGCLRPRWPAVSVFIKAGHLGRAWMVLEVPCSSLVMEAL
jgi:hypothetical protein